tara:strand:- start:77 stop:292 length:216 start_codon:yes stop_codon:yes gene_type:complete
MENELSKKIEQIDKKIDKILEIIEENKENCKKMKHHITFIESVYENVKNPLGYLCNKVKIFSSETKYSLEN